MKNGIFSTLYAVAMALASWWIGSNFGTAWGILFYGWCLLAYKIADDFL